MIEFGYGLLIFDKSYLSWTLTKKYKLSVSIHYLCNGCTHLMSNLIYGYTLELRRSSSDLVLTVSHFLTFAGLMIFDSYPLKSEKSKHGSKTLAACGGIRGVDDTSS